MLVKLLLKQNRAECYLNTDMIVAIAGNYVHIANGGVVHLAPESTKALVKFMFDDTDDILDLTGETK